MIRLLIAKRAGKFNLFGIRLTATYAGIDWFTTGLMAQRALRVLNIIYKILGARKHQIWERRSLPFNTELPTCMEKPTKAQL